MTDNDIQVTFNDAVMSCKSLQFTTTKNYTQHFCKWI